MHACDNPTCADGAIRAHQASHSVVDGEAQNGSSGSSLFNNSSVHQRCNNESASQPIINSNKTDALGVGNSLQHQITRVRSQRASVGRGRRRSPESGSIQFQQQQQQQRQQRNDDGDVINNNNKHFDGPNSNPFSSSSFLPTHVGASVKFRRNKAKVANEKQLSTLPYHVKSVKKYNMEEIFKRTNETTSLRLKEVIQEVNRPFGDDVNNLPNWEVPISKSAKQHHTKLRLEHGTIRLVTPEQEQQYPTKGVVQEFCVVELKKNNKTGEIYDRLRQIDHPVQQNDILRAKNFKTTAPLHHFSHYHRKITHPLALVADLEASFYGFELSDPVTRSFYRFRDETGQLYEQNVLMMGLVASVELQQIISSVIAGHEDYVKPQYKAPVVPEIWVDNMRYCGNKEILKKCESFLLKSSFFCNASIEIEEISYIYDFLGATWDHQNKTVRLADKTFNKLPKILPDQISAHDLEGLIGRLIFVAQIMQDPLVNHYWLLKWARRFFNGLNSGRISPEQMINIPPTAAASLSRWLAAASKPHKIRFSNFLNKTGTLFTDASLFGWGAVLIMPDGSIQVAGGKLTEADHKNNINIAESIALDKSLTSFKSFISCLSKLDILVDNTSVEFNVRRGMPRSDELASYIKSIWHKIFDLQISIFINRVSTKLNPADSISRGQQLDFNKLNQAFGQFKSSQNNSNKRTGLEERHVLEV
jgi:hypothetical protein